MDYPTKKIVGIDLMGGDCSPAELLAVLHQTPFPQEVSLLCFGTSEWKEKSQPFAFKECPQVIEMGESPIPAVKKKPHSSICEGIKALQSEQIHAFVSRGNTGALVACAKMVIPSFPSILRPALMARLPTPEKPVAVLDVGGSVQASPMHLLQFAELGAAYQMSCQVPYPSIGLLNIGSEATKGTARLRALFEKFEHKLPPCLRFVGNVEAKAVFEGKVHVLITDGFTGNIFLKAAEGAAQLLFDQLPPLSPLLELQEKQESGALLIGLEKLVMKCHGYCSAAHFRKAVLNLVHMLEANTLDRVKSFLHQIKSSFPS